MLSEHDEIYRYVDNKINDVEKELLIKLSNINDKIDNIRIDTYEKNKHLLNTFILSIITMIVTFIITYYLTNKGG